MIIIPSVSVTSGSESLLTDVFLPDDFLGTVLLIRTPYDRTRYHAQVKGWLASGFGLVVQDVRGRYASTGRWDPYVNEREDGNATLHWLHQQEWCTGVIPVGASYEAATAFAVAAESKGGSFVKGLISKVPTLGLGSVKLDSSGILRLKEHVIWWLAHGGRRTSSFELPDLCLENDPGLLAAVPVVEMMTRSGLPKDASMGFDRAIEIALCGERREADVITEDELSTLSIPTLHIGGWKDMQIEETFRHYRLSGSGLDERPPRSLLVGNWGHDLGARSGDKMSTRYQLDWLRGLRAGNVCESIRVYERSKAEWLSDEEMREPTTSRVMHLCNDGLLSECAPERPLRITTTYRPCEVRQRVGRICWRWRSKYLRDEFLLNGQSELRIVSAPLQAPLDWVCKLIRIRDGERLRLSEGASTSIVGQESVSIRLSPTVIRFLPGDELQLQLAHDDYPVLAPQIHESNDRYFTNEISESIWGADLKGAVLELPVTEAAL